MSRYLIGVDIGQQVDPTAVVVIDRWEPSTEMRGFLNVVMAERRPLGEAYYTQVEAIRAMISRLDHGWGYQLFVDHTGVGRGVVEMFERGNLGPTTPITITAGTAATTHGSEWRVPKADLIGAMQVVLQNRRLRIAPGCKEAKTLVAELKAYVMTLAGSVTHYANDPARAPHDDLVIALCLAAYGASKMGPGTPTGDVSAAPWQDDESIRLRSAAAAAPWS